MTRLTRWLLVALFWGCLGLPLLDHHLAERFPFHDHLWLGHGTAPLAIALATHRHLADVPHAHDPQTGRPLLHDPDLLSLRPLDGLTAVVLALLTVGLLVPQTLALPRPAASGRRLAFGPHRPTGLSLRQPDPPPRRVSVSG